MFQKASARQPYAIAAETILLLCNIVQIIIVLVFFVGGTAPDALYIYMNVFQIAVALFLLAGLGTYDIVTEVKFSVYCHLIPIVMHIFLHSSTLIAAVYLIGSPHPETSLITTLIMMIAASYASISYILVYLHNA